LFQILLFVSELLVIPEKYHLHILLTCHRFIFQTYRIFVNTIHVIESNNHKEPSPPSESSSTTLPPQTWTDYFLELAILKRRNLQEFRVLLLMTVCLNIFGIIAEIIDITYRTDDTLPLPSAYAILSIIAAILALINIALIVKLIILPTTRSALLSCALILLLEVIYVVQFIIFYTTSDSNNVVLAFNILFIIFQVLTSIVLYRFWEYVYYTYDDDKVSRSDLASLRSSLYDVESPIVKTNTMTN